MTNLKVDSSSLSDGSQYCGGYGYKNITSDIINPEFAQDNLVRSELKAKKNCGRVEENLISQSQSSLRESGQNNTGRTFSESTIFICPKPKKNANMVEKVIASKSAQNVCESNCVNVSGERSSHMEILESNRVAKIKPILVAKEEKIKPASEESLAGCGVGSVEKSANALIEAYRSGRLDSCKEQTEEGLDINYLNSLQEIGEGDYVVGADGKRVYTHNPATKVQERLNKRLEEASEEYVETLEKSGVVEPGVLGLSYVDSVAYETILLDDDEEDESEGVVQSSAHSKGCLLSNVKLDRNKANSWGTEEWLKFFLKSAKSMQFSIDYYDKLIERHASCSFYYSHVAKYGSMENFYEEIINIIARKSAMIELKAFVKRLYKELTSLEIMVVDKFIFGADNADEITKSVSLRTMYRMADRIVAKLIEFMSARGYTPVWCYKTFSAIL